MPSVTLRPNGAGGGNPGTTVVGAATAWQAMVESSPDGDTSYITPSAAEMYSYPSVDSGSVIPSGATITDATVYVYAKGTGGQVSVYYTKDNFGEFVLGGDFNTTSTYDLYSATSTINISTSAPLTRADFTTAVPNFYILSFFPGVRVSQVYMVVNYTGGSVVINAPLFAGD